MSQGRAAVAAALLGPAPHLGSLNRNAFPCDVAGYLEHKIAGRVVEIQGERTVVGIAATTHSDCLTEVDGSQEGSVGVVRPYAVREFESPVLSVLPHSQADVPTSGINIRVVNLSPPGIPELVRFLDRYVSPIIFAWAYAQLRRKEETLRYLEQAYEEHAPDMVRVQGFPNFDFVHPEPRYRAIIKKMGLPPAY